MMITNCAVCWKAFDVLYPDLWRYKRRRGCELFLCSWSCLRKFDNENGKEETSMTKMRKDGTPANKPGPKPKKIEMPEVPENVLKSQLVPIETPVAPEVPEQLVPATVRGMVIREVEGNFDRYRCTDIGAVAYIDFESKDLMDTLSLTVEQWKKFREEQVKAARILGVEL